MLRRALTPRWLGLLALALVLAATMVRLGFWQLGVARDAGQVEAVRAAASKPVVPVAQVLTPHQSFPADASARKVSMTGHYDPALQSVVGPRRLHGVSGWWVVTPFVVDGPTPTTIPLVRGFVAGGAPARGTLPPPTGTVTVLAGLAPGESPTSGTPKDPTMGSVDLAQYVNLVDGPMYNAFGFVISESGESVPGPSTANAAQPRLELVPPPQPEHGLRWRNLAYALQWWVFAAFVLYAWGRMLRDEHVEQTRPPTDETSNTSTEETEHEHAQPTA